MPKILDILGYLIINNEEDEVNYLINEYNYSYSHANERRYFDDEFIDEDCDDKMIIKSIDGFSYIKDKYSDKIFGHLKVLGKDINKIGNHYYCICECECGKIKSVFIGHLLSGATKSCGCIKIKYSDLSGQEFGKLMVRCLDEERTTQTHQKYYICDCKCGGVKSILGYSLINGSTTSCGCNHSHNTYDLTSKDYGIGYTKNGTIFLFDKEDYEKISQYMWTNHKAGYIVNYQRDENGNEKIVLMHRFVMGVEDPNVVVDHIHHNLADNRKSELRIVSHQKNMCNMRIRIDNTSGHTGVSYNKKRAKWVSQLTFNGRHITIGYYSTKEEAIKAREEAEKRYFGEYRYQGTITTDQILNRN